MVPCCSIKNSNSHHNKLFLTEVRDVQIPISINSHIRRRAAWTSDHHYLRYIVRHGHRGVESITFRNTGQRGLSSTFCSQGMHVEAVRLWNIEMEEAGKEEQEGVNTVGVVAGETGLEGNSRFLRVWAINCFRTTNSSWSSTISRWISRSGVGAAATGRVG